ncbi:MAG: avidin/streptavidin family protein [Chloroflexi bacterium]|nr:avidin/streptavidin family protein [Chloroflexota bacterium]
MGIEGKWFNELGSLMTIEPIGANVFTGEYQTRVGDAGGIYTVSGQTDGDQQSLGWTVGWVNNDKGDFHSVTSWSGQYQTVGGDETITAMWLLTMDTASGDDWKSTFVGKDVFMRLPPSADIVARASRAPTSHPG